MVTEICSRNGSARKQLSSATPRQVEEQGVPTLVSKASLAPLRSAPATLSPRSTQIHRVTKLPTLSETRKDSAARRKMEEDRRRLNHLMERADLCSNVWAEALAVPWEEADGPTKTEATSPGTRWGSAETCSTTIQEKDREGRNARWQVTCTTAGAKDKRCRR